MNIIDVLLTGLGLSMDAAAVSAADGLAEPKMKPAKMILIALMFGVFQGVMPIAGYYLGTVFAEAVARVAPYLAFALLLLVGGKMLYEGIREAIRLKKSAKVSGGNSPEPDAAAGENGENSPRDKASSGAAAKKPLGALSILVQAVATSIDALAVGVGMAALAGAGEMKIGVFPAAGLIAAVTLAVCVAALFLGKKFGKFLAGKAEIAGGVILIAIGLKILIEGLV